MDLNWTVVIEDDFFISDAEMTGRYWQKNKDAFNMAGFSITKEEEWKIIFKARMPFPCVEEMEKKRDQLIVSILSK